VPSSPGPNLCAFGSPPRRGSQPTSQRFPRGRNPLLVRPGGFPRATCEPPQHPAAQSRGREGSLTLSSTRSLSLAQFASREASAAATPASRGRRIPGGRRLAAHLSLRPATHLPALGGDVPPEIHGSTSISRNHIGGCLTHTAASSLLHRRRYRHPSLQVGPPPPTSPSPTVVSRYARV